MQYDRYDMDDDEYGSDSEYDQSDQEMQEDVLVKCFPIKDDRGCQNFMINNKEMKMLDKVIAREIYNIEQADKQDE